MGEVTEEEMVQIANNFLLSSPPGEFLEVAIGAPHLPARAVASARLLLLALAREILAIWPVDLDTS